MNYYSQIADYLEGSLNPNEKARFEEEMAKDSLLSDAVKYFDQVDELLDSLVEDDIRKKVDEIKNTNTNNRKISQLLKWAAVTLLAVGVIWIFYQKKAPSGLDLYTEFYREYIPEQQRSGTVDQIIDSEQSDYAQAHSLLVNGQLSQAESIFINLQQSLDPQMQDQAQWFLLMTKLKSENISKADSILSSILSRPDHQYIAKAKRLDKLMQKHRN